MSVIYTATDYDTMPFAPERNLKPKDKYAPDPEWNHTENAMIFQRVDTGLFYFFDEGYWDHGPFKSFNEALHMLERYFHFLNTGEIS